jgi:DHA2 family multidrug resistance protein
MAAVVTAAEGSTTGASAPARSLRPLVGVAAVLMGAFIATLNTRLTTVGLADIRGGLSLGFDEGSWLTSVFSAAQMVVAPAAAWLSTVFGVRRFLLWSCVIFGLASLLLPLAGEYDTIMGLQILRGLSVGTFIPAALGFILRGLPPQWWIWGIAAYAFRFVFSQNVSASLEAWYSESGQWQWIFWQNVVLVPVMMALISFGMPRQAVDRNLLNRTDWGGILFAGFGFGLLYAAFDQGNRLDWLESGTVIGLLVAGGLLIVAFVINEAVVPFPLVHLNVLRQRKIWVPALMILVYGFGSTATAYILPDYLTRVQNLRALQIGDVLNWIALPQLILVPAVALALRWTDARLLLALGLALIAVGSWMNTGLTHDWANDTFMPSQIVEAIGLAIAIVALITYAVANITPPQAAAMAVVIQTARLFGTEIGAAAMQTLVRIQEQVHSNLIGQHLTTGSEAANAAITAYGAPFTARPTGLGDAISQGIGVIGRLVQREAYVLAYIDGFWIVAWVLTASLLLVLLLPPPPPNPMTPPRLGA